MPVRRVVCCSRARVGGADFGNGHQTRVSVLSPELETAADFERQCSAEHGEFRSRTQETILLDGDEVMTSFRTDSFGQGSGPLRGYLPINTKTRWWDRCISKTR